jgi:hypothetical protein
MQATGVVTPPLGLPVRPLITHDSLLPPVHTDGRPLRIGDEFNPFRQWFGGIVPAGQNNLADILTPIEERFYKELLSASGRNGCCWVGTATLARWMNRNVRTVTRVIRALKEKQFIRVQRRGAGYRRRHNKYTFVVNSHLFATDALWENCVNAEDGAAIEPRAEGEEAAKFFLFPEEIGQKCPITEPPSLMNMVHSFENKEPVLPAAGATADESLWKTPFDDEPGSLEPAAKVPDVPARPAESPTVEPAGAPEAPHWTEGTPFTAPKRPWAPVAAKTPVCTETPETSDTENAIKVKSNAEIPAKRPYPSTSKARMPERRDVGRAVKPTRELIFNNPLFGRLVNLDYHAEFRRSGQVLPVSAEDSTGPPGAAAAPEPNQPCPPGETEESAA